MYNIKSELIFESKFNFKKWMAVVKKVWLVYKAFLLRNPLGGAMYSSGITFACGDLFS